MFKNLIFTFFLLFSSFITIYPSKKENNKLFDYCYSLEKIISINSVEKNKNLSKSYKTFAKEITSLINIKFPRNYLLLLLYLINFFVWQDIGLRRYIQEHFNLFFMRKANKELINIRILKKM